MRGSNAFAIRRTATAWWFLAPALAAVVLVAAWPLMRTVALSFSEADLAEISNFRFVGFNNYLRYYDGLWEGVLADPVWWRAVGNTLLFTAVSVPLEAFLGVVFALVLNASFPGRSLVRAVVLIPWAIPTIVSAKMWGWMLHDQFGIVNDMGLRLGLIDSPLAWTASPGLAMASVIMVDVWKTTPFVALLVLAGLQMVPKDCYEAAKVDGAGPIAVFFKITLPLVVPALTVAVVFRTLDALRVFDLIYVLTANSEDTLSMSVYARQQLVDFQDVGYGSAASTLLFLTVAVIAAAIMTAVRVGRREAGPWQ